MTGISRRTCYDWRERDNIFDEAIDELKELFIEDLEEEARKRAKGEKPSKMPDVLLMFLLKALRPQVYREHPPVEAVMPGNITFIMNMPPRVDTPDQIQPLMERQFPNHSKPLASKEVSPKLLESGKERETEEDIEE